MSLAHIHFNKIQSILETIAKHQDFVDNFIPYGDLSNEDNDWIVNIDKNVIKLLKIRLDEMIDEAKKDLIQC